MINIFKIIIWLTDLFFLRNISNFIMILINRYKFLNLCEKGYSIISKIT